MKKVLWLISFICSVAYSQKDANSQSESKRVYIRVDKYTDKKTVKSIPVSFSEDDGNTENRSVYVQLDIEEKNGKITPSHLYFWLKDESCVNKGSTIHVAFDNGEKTKLVSHNDFNCDGENYFKLGDKADLFKKSNIKGIVYTNIINSDTWVFKEEFDEEEFMILHVKDYLPIASYIKEVLTEIDKINEGTISMPMREE